MAVVAPLSNLNTTFLLSRSTLTRYLVKKFRPNSMRSKANLRVWYLAGRICTVHFITRSISSDTGSYSSMVNNFVISTTAHGFLSMVTIIAAER